MAYVLPNQVVMTVPPCVDRLVLIRLDGHACRYELSALMVRVTEARWVVCDASGELTIDDLAEEEVIPLAQGTPMPDAGRPFRVRNDWGESWLAPIRLRALQLADIHGAPAPVKAGPSDGVWIYADTAHPEFSHPVDLA